MKPDFDIIEMGFDDYLTKPVDQSDQISLVDTLLELDSYDACLNRYYRLSSKKAALETSKTEKELARSEEYTPLMKGFERVRERVDAMAKEKSAEELFSRM